jgi:hypothetical protein
MRNPVDWALDFYDYKINYYRNFMHRRILFGGLLEEKNQLNALKFDIFYNRDYENSGRLVAQTGLIGFILGAGIGGSHYVFEKSVKGTAVAKNLVPLCLGMAAVGS